MHELSMAQGIINAVLETAEANNATEVNEVTVEVGRLAMINPEQLEFILGVLIENTIMEDAKIVFEEIRPECDSLSVETLNGKDIVVKNIVIEKPDDA